MFLGLEDFLIYPFLTRALIGIIGLSIMCALLSPLVIARRQAFMGAALSHATLVGLALGLSWFSSDNALGVFLSTLAVTIVLALILAESTYKNPLPRDSLIGLFFTTCMGLGMIIHQLGAAKNIDLMSYLFGNIYLLSDADLWTLCVCLLLVAFAILVPLKKWLYLSFSERAAEMAGLNVRASHYIFLSLLTLAIVAGLKLAGTVLINTLIIVPGMVALRLAKNNTQVFIYSLSFSLITGLIGLILSNRLGVSLGPVLSLIQFIALIVCLAPRWIFKNSR